MKGFRGDPQRHAEAGKKGGAATARTHNLDFYQRIGRLGGLVSPGKFFIGDPRAIEAAKKGREIKKRRV